MLSTRLEKAILAGWATYRTMNHAYGSFGSITIPKDHMAIVTRVKWNHFLNPPKTEHLTWRELFKYNEYQLKIDGKKSINFLQFRNKFDFKITNPTLQIDLSTRINVDDFNRYILPIAQQPILEDVYFVCEDYINLTITRNVYINSISTDFKPLNPKANQPPPPVGLGTLNVLTSLEGTSPGSDTYTYTPVTFPNAKPITVPINPQHMETYTQPISKDSLLTDVKGEVNNLINYQTPLIELAIVIFNCKYQDKIMNG